MPNSSVAITPGAGANIAINPVGGLSFQVVKLDFGPDGASLPAVADSSGFLKVNLAAIGVAAVPVSGPGSGGAFPITAASPIPVSASAALPVSAPNTAPVSVRISNGSGNIDTLPVSGTITANQGTPGATAWPHSITDGVNGTVKVTAVGGNPALNVNVVQSVAPGGVADKGTFTEGTTQVTPIAGEYNTSPTSPSTGQAAAVQITQNRGLHVNLRASGGTEIGTSGAPVRVDPVGTTTQPVSGTVTATLSATVLAGVTAVQVNYATGGGTQNLPMVGLALPASAGPVAGGTATNPLRIDPVGTTVQPVNHTQINGNAVVTVVSGVQKVSLGDSGGSSITAGNPLPVTLVPNASTSWSQHVAYTASQSAQAIRTPTSGKTSFVLGLIIIPTATGTLEIFDNTAGTTADLLNGTMPTSGVFVVRFDPPRPLSAINNILRYTTGSGAAGDVTAWGYEA